MSIKLKEVLLESSTNKIHNLFEAEENKEDASEKESDTKTREVEDNIHTLSKSTIENISKTIANKINSSIPDIDKIEKEDLENPLGIITYEKLKQLNLISIKNLNLDPMQVKGEQQKGLTTIDFKVYEKNQIVPLFLTNSDLENLGGEKSGQEYAAIFYIPAIYGTIKKENLELHKKLFGLKEKKGYDYYAHTAIDILHVQMVKPEEIEVLQQAFIKGNITPISRIESLGSRRIPTGANSKKGESKVAQSKNESTTKVDISKLHEHTMQSLLFESNLNEGIFDLLKFDTFPTKSGEAIGFSTKSADSNVGDNAADVFKSYDPNNFIVDDNEELSDHLNDKTFKQNFDYNLLKNKNIQCNTFNRGKVIKTKINPQEYSKDNNFPNLMMYNMFGDDPAASVRKIFSANQIKEKMVR